MQETKWLRMVPLTTDFGLTIILIYGNKALILLKRGCRDERSKSAFAKISWCLPQASVNTLHFDLFLGNSVYCWDEIRTVRMSDQFFTVSCPFWNSCKVFRQMFPRHIPFHSKKAHLDILASSPPEFIGFLGIVRAKKTIASRMVPTIYGGNWPQTFIRGNMWLYLKQFPSMHPKSGFAPGYG